VSDDVTLFAVPIEADLVISSRVLSIIGIAARWVRGMRLRKRFSRLAVDYSLPNVVNLFPRRLQEPFVRSVHGKELSVVARRTSRLICLPAHATLKRTGG